MKIIITGSLGHIGEPLTKRLVKEGQDVTVISSSPERRHEIEKLGAKPAIGTLKDTGFLTETFQGADVVHCMVPPTYYKDPSIDPMKFYRDMGNSYKEALENGGVKRAIHLSSFGAHLSDGTGFIEGSHHVEQILNGAEGSDVTHIRPGSFYYNFEAYIPMIKNAGAIYVNYGEGTLQLVSPKDIAAAIADEILRPGGEQIRYVVSDERTGEEVARVLGQAIDKPDLKWVVISDEEMKQSLKKAGRANHLAAGLTQLNRAFREGRLAEDYIKHRSCPGEVKLEDYAREFARVYEQK